MADDGVIWNGDFAYVPDINNVPSDAKQSLWVSKSSRYGDNVWDLRSLRPEKPDYLVMNFRTVTDLGLDLCDPYFSPLLESYKDFRYIQLKQAFGGKGKASPVSIVHNHNNRLLLKWMMERRLTSFSALTKKHLQDYLDYCKTLPNLMKKDKNGNPVAVNPGGVLRRVEIVVHLYELRRKLKDAIQHNPFGDVPVSKWAGKNQNYNEKNKTPRIPEPIAKDLAQQALDFIRTDGDKIIALYGELEGLLRRPKGNSAMIAKQLALQDYAIETIRNGRDWPRWTAGKFIGQIHRPQLCRALGWRDVRTLNEWRRSAAPTLLQTFDAMAAAVTAQDIDACVLPFEFEYPEDIKDLHVYHTRPLVEKYGYRDMDDFYASGICKLTACCYVTVAMFTGMRISEVLYLQHNDNPSEHCLRSEVVKIGGKETVIYWIHGRSFKTSRDRNGRACKWWATPAVKEAVDILSRLTRHVRTRRNNPKLFVNITGFNGYRSESKTYADQWVNFWINCLRDIFKLPKHEVDGKMIDWEFASHQFRKTYARIMSGTKYGIKFLQDQFQHASFIMTMWYASPSLDEDLLAEISTEAVDYQLEMTRQLLESKSELAGGGAAEWNEARLKYIGKVGEDRESYLRHVASTMTMYDNGVGVCVYNARKAQCSGGAGSGPKCIPTKCANAVVDIRHAPIHIITFHNLIKIKDMPRCQSVAQLAVINEKLEQSKEILRPLRGKRLDNVMCALEAKGLIPPGFELDLN